MWFPVIGFHERIYINIYKYYIYLIFLEDLSKATVRFERNLWIQRYKKGSDVTLQGDVVRRCAKFPTSAFS